MEYKGIEMIPSKKLTVFTLTVDNDQYNIYKKSRRQIRKICKKKTVLTQPFDGLLRLSFLLYILFDFAISFKPKLKFYK